MSKHVFHDGLGEVRIYASISTCECNWCRMQRSPQTRRHHLEVDATPAQAGDLLDSYAREIATRDNKPYIDSFHEVCKQFPQVFKLYSQGEYGQRDESPPLDGENAGMQIDSLARDVMKREGISYSDALRQAMKDNPSLADAYNTELPKHARNR